jgi:negative regulator of sigma E activity
MTVAVPCLAVLLAVGSGLAFPAERPTSAADIVQAMRQAMQSDGFEVRLSMVTTSPSGERSPQLKLAIVGQFDDVNARVVVRVISPQLSGIGRAMAERSQDGEVRIVPVIAAADAERLFDSAIAIEDLLAPWWNWPRQELVGNSRVAGRDCVRVRSRGVDIGSDLREVVSCVDVAGGLALRTDLYGSNHRLLREITVTQLVRRQSGLDAAKMFSVAAANGLRTDVEVYAGDEHYWIRPDTFDVGGNAVPTGR